MSFFATRWSGGDVGSGLTTPGSVLTTPGSGFGVLNEMPSMARHGGADEEEAWCLEVAEREEEEDPRCSVAVGGEENDLFGSGDRLALRLATTSQ
jgi:hypothetical protein